MWAGQYISQSALLIFAVNKDDLLASESMGYNVYQFRSTRPKGCTQDENLSWVLSASFIDPSS